MRNNFTRCYCDNLFEVCTITESACESFDKFSATGRLLSCIERIQLWNSIYASFDTSTLRVVQDDKNWSNSFLNTTKPFGNTHSNAKSHIFNKTMNVQYLTQVHLNHTIRVWMYRQNHCHWVRRLHAEYTQTTQLYYLKTSYFSSPEMIQYVNCHQINEINWFKTSEPQRAWLVL